MRLGGVECLHKSFSSYDVIYIHTRSYNDWKYGHCDKRVSIIIYIDKMYTGDIDEVVYKPY